MADVETQIWAIAVKGTSSDQQFKAAANEHASVVSFPVPGAQLRVGTLDSLMSLSDDLMKMEILAEGTTTKFYKQLYDLRPEPPTIKGGASARARWRLAGAAARWALWQSPLQSLCLAHLCLQPAPWPDWLRAA